MTRADALLGVLLALGCAWVLWQSTRLTYGTEFTPGPGFAPLWYAAIGLLMSVGLAAAAWRNRHPAAPVENGGRAGLLRVIAALAGLVVMMQLIPIVGLMLALLAFLAFLALGVERLPPISGLAASVGTVAFIYVVFVRLLGVPVPSGPLGI